MRQQTASRRQELDSEGGAPEQWRTELRLEVLNLAAQRGLGDVQAPRGAPDVSLLGDRDEIAQLIEAHGARVPRRASPGGHTKRVLEYSSRARHSAVMSIELFRESDFPALRRAGRAAAETLAHVGRRLRPGVLASDVDAWVRADTARRGGRPSQLGYRVGRETPPFPAAVCVSVDDVVCHGIPSSRQRLEAGSIVNVDVTTELGGFHGDTSCTFAIGEVSAEAKHVMSVARRCLEAAISRVRPGARLGDIGAIIEEIAVREGCSVVREFGGHGIGRVMHAEPHVPHHGPAGVGPRLRAGMAFTIEPMVNLGGPEVVQEDDGWTVVTRDGSLSAQFEHTVLVTETGVEVLTLLDSPL